MAMKEVESRKNLALIVDDEPDTCSMLNDKLSSSGFACSTCTNGKAAREKLEQDTIALVLSDLRMSGMDLLNDVQRISPHTQFVMMADKDDTCVALEATKQGAADYLVKPLQFASLAASVERAMERKRLKSQVENYRQDLECMVQDRMRQLQSALNRIELICDETLEALAAKLDLHDTETAGHSQRVSRYSTEIAKVMGCTTPQLKELARGACLHDIGKMGIPDDILLKAGKLSAEETAIMETHVQIGYELVSWFAFLAGAAEIILTHHEHYDGTGYPQGLAEEQIPLRARIFAVADTLDAMTSDRPYRRALPFATARGEIICQSGHHYDPKVVQAFLSIPERVWEEVRWEVAQGAAASRVTLAPNLGGGFLAPSARLL
jgi:putative nucleotidyltransferase with HDIG domain